MKLLFDQNISQTLVERVQNIFSGTTHVRLIGLERADDREIWNYAGERDFVIVSKDADFYQRAFVYGSPPKIIWIQRGNCTTDDIENILISRRTDIQRFSVDSEATFLILK